MWLPRWLCCTRQQEFGGAPANDPRSVIPTGKGQKEGAEDEVPSSVQAEESSRIGAVLQPCSLSQAECGGQQLPSVTQASAAAGKSQPPRSTMLPPPAASPLPAPKRRLSSGAALSSYRQLHLDLGNAAAALSRPAPAPPGALPRAPLSPTDAHAMLTPEMDATGRFSTAFGSELINGAPQTVRVCSVMLQCTSSNAGHVSHVPLVECCTYDIFGHLAYGVKTSWKIVHDCRCLVVHSASPSTLKRTLMSPEPPRRRAEHGEQVRRDGGGARARDAVRGAPRARDGSGVCCAARRREQAAPPCAARCRVPRVGDVEACARHGGCCGG
jgi:hypothetical protein